MYKSNATTTIIRFLFYLHWGIHNVVADRRAQHKHECDRQRAAERKLCIRNMMRAFLPIVCQRCIVDVYTDSSTLILCRSWMFFFSRRPLHSVWHRLLFYSAALVSNSHFMPDTTLFFQLIFHFIISHYHLVPGRWRVRWFVFHFDASMINFMWRKYGLILSFLFAFHSYLCNFIAPNSVCALLLCCWPFFVPFHFGF